jgi:hypothetical protein
MAESPTHSDVLRENRHSKATSLDWQPWVLGLVAFVFYLLEHRRSKLQFRRLPPARTPTSPPVTALR